MTNIAMVKPWPIEIDGLPIKNGGSFHGYVKQRVNTGSYPTFLLMKLPPKF